MHVHMLLYTGVNKEGGAGRDGAGLVQLLEQRLCDEGCWETLFDFIRREKLDESLDLGGRRAAPRAELTDIMLFDLQPK